MYNVMNTRVALSWQFPLFLLLNPIKPVLFLFYYELANVLEYQIGDRLCKQNFPRSQLSVMSFPPKYHVSGVTKCLKRLQILQGASVDGYCD